MSRFVDRASLQGRVACVTGGAGNLGLGFCAVLAELGAEICLIDVLDEKAWQRASDLEQRYGVKATAIVADITSEESVCAAVGELLARHQRLDILVNNAAYPPGSLAPDGLDLVEQGLAQWQANTAVILTGTFLMTRACVPALGRSGCGSIVNIASIYGSVGADPSLYSGTSIINEAHYAAAKGGVIQLTRYFATTLAPSIRANCIAPGGVESGQPIAFRERYAARTPLRRMARVEDLQGAMAFFASDLSAYVTGQTLFVDGGWTAW